MSCVKHRTHGTRGIPHFLSEHFCCHMSCVMLVTMRFTCVDFFISSLLYLNMLGRTLTIEFSLPVPAILPLGCLSPSHDVHPLRPRYSVDSFQVPLYSADPLLCKTGFYQARSPPSTVMAATPWPPGGEFVKESKEANSCLHLYRQSDNVIVSVFGIHRPVEGTLELSKTKGFVFVTVLVRVSLIRMLTLGISI
jgi:hypothetical protein